MRALVVVAFAAACGKPVVAPAPVGPAPTPDPKPAPPTVTRPKDEIDHGAFLQMVSGTNTRRESFSIRRLDNGNLVLSATTENLVEKDENSGGEIEVDAQFRPIRGAHREITSADGKTFKLGGTPLTLEVTRDDGREPLKLVAKTPMDAYIQGPGLIAMTTFCRVTNEALLATFGDNEVSTEYLEAYVAAPVGELKRVVLNIVDLDFELVCSGDKLVAGGNAQFGFWFVREDRAADLTALQKAARPGPHAWKSPQDESEKWRAERTWLVDKKWVVTIDERRRMQRLTTFDAATGRELAHRDLKTKMGANLDCVLIPGARLLCLSGVENFLRVIDAKTLTDVVDYFPIVTAAFGKVDPPMWSFDKLDGAVIDIVLDENRVARIDTKKGTAVSTPMPKQRTYARQADATRCEAVRSDGIEIGKEKWSIDFSPTGTTIKRMAGTKELPPFEIPLKHATLLACAPKGFAVYAVTFDDAKSTLALVRRDGKLEWQVALESHPDDNIRVNGNDLLVPTYDGNRRVLAIDSKKGAIRWTAVGPQAAK